MALSLGAMTPERADTVAGWFDAASAWPAPGALVRLCDGEAAAVLDGDELVGVLCVGSLAHVPDGPAPRDDTTDVWLAVRPERAGRGVATRAAELAVEALRVGGHTRLRTALPESNEAGRRLALRVGFLPVPCGRDDGGLEVLEREVLA